MIPYLSSAGLTEHIIGLFRVDWIYSSTKSTSFKYRDTKIYPDILALLDLCVRLYHLLLVEMVGADICSLS